MAKRTVVWTKIAQRQRRDILAYWTIRNGSSDYAQKLITQAKRRIRLIVEHPEACKKSEYPDTREAAMGNFSIYYKFTEDYIVITAFWDNRQDPDKILELLT